MKGRTHTLQKLFVKLNFSALLLKKNTNICLVGVLKSESHVPNYFYQNKLVLILVRKITSI